MGDSKTRMGSEARLEALEAELASALKRVRPPQEMIHRLRSRIHFPDRSEIASRLRDWQRLMLVLGGAISVAVVLLTVARALYHVVGRRDVG